MATRNLTVSKRNTKLKERMRGEIAEVAQKAEVHTLKSYELPEQESMMAAEPHSDNDN